MEPLLSLPASSEDGKLNVDVFPNRIELLWKGFLTTTAKAILAAATNGLSYAVTGRTGDKELETLPLNELLDISATKRFFSTRLTIKTPGRTIRIDVSRKEAWQLQELLARLLDEFTNRSSPTRDVGETDARARVGPDLPYSSNFPASTPLPASPSFLGPGDTPSESGVPRSGTSTSKEDAGESSLAELMESYESGVLTFDEFLDAKRKAMEP